MEQQTMSLQYKVGIFVGIGLVAVCASILVLGGDRALFTRYVYLHTELTEVQGLFPGSVVSLAGMPVGNIKQMDFQPGSNKLDLTLKIDRRFHDRLVAGTIAEARTQGALGDRYIYLTPGPSGSKVLENDAKIEATETDYMKLLTDRQDGVARVVDLIKELHILVASFNQEGRTGEMMKNMTEASRHFKSTLAQLDGLLGDLRGEIPENKKLKRALANLSDVMEKIDQGKGTLGLLINDPTLYQNLKGYLGGSPRNRYMKDMIRETIQKSEARP